jgi:hypothetical protein
MSPPMAGQLYGGWLTKIAQRFQHAIDGMQAIYNFEYGDEFEIAVCQVLRGVLPQRVGVCRGFVVPREGEPAGDDIIIFDKARFPTLRALDGALDRKEHVPAEAVLVYIEAKHTLKVVEPKSTLRTAIHQVGHVKVVPRPSVPLEQISFEPNCRLVPPLNVAIPEVGFPNNRNPWYGAIFARHLDVSGYGFDTTPPRQILMNELLLLRADEQGIRLPDCIAAGNTIGLPFHRQVDPYGIPHAATRPMLTDQTELLFFDCDGPTLGLAVVQLLWAMEFMLPAPIKWTELVANGLPQTYAYGVGNPLR